MKERGTCPRYVRVRYLSEWLTRFVFINGRYFAVSLYKRRHKRCEVYSLAGQLVIHKLAMPDIAITIL